MPFPSWVLPAILTGANAVGNLWGAKKQTGALREANQINQQATDAAMRAILSLYDRGQGSLSPYQNVGPAALNRLQELAHGGSIPAPASVQPPPPSAMGMMFPQQDTFSPAAGIRNAMATGPNGEPVNVQQQRGSLQSRNAMLGGMAGMAALPLAGAGIGAAMGGGLGAGGALGGASWALGGLAGPIGLAAGGVGALIASQFGKNNPDKAAATRGINEVTKLIWGTTTPGTPPEQLTEGIVADVIRGKKNVQQGKQEVNMLLNEWERGMTEQGLNEGIIRSSVETQKRHLQPLRDIFGRIEAGQRQQGRGLYG